MNQDSLKVDWKKESGEHYKGHADGLLKDVFPWFVKDVEVYANFDFFNASVLEIGGGPGHMAEQFLTKSISRVVEADLSEGMLRFALEKNLADDRLEFIQANVENLPFKTNTFDLIFSRGSIFFWQDLPAALLQIKRVLSANGVAFIGGGYGMETPEEIVAPIIAKRKERSQKIPKIDLDKLIKLAETIGGRAKIISKKGRGFWFIWQPNA